MAFQADQHFGVLRPTVAALGSAIDITFEAYSKPAKIRIENTSAAAVRLFATEAAQTTGTVYFEIPATTGSLDLFNPPPVLYLTSVSGDVVVQIIAER